MVEKEVLVNEDLNITDLKDEDSTESVDKNIEEAQRENTEEPKQETEKAKQSREENAKFAELRRQQELAKAYTKGKLDASKVNTFTGEEITDQADLEIFELQKDIEKNGQDPTDIKVVAKFLADKKREDEKSKNAEQERTIKLKEMATIDREKFSKQFPNLNILEVAKDEHFMKFCGKRFGEELTTDLYVEYQELQNVLYDKYKIEQAKELARQQNKKLADNGQNGGEKKDSSNNESYTDIRSKYGY